MAAPPIYDFTFFKNNTGELSVDDNLEKYRAPYKISAERYNENHNLGDHTEELDELSREVSREYYLMIIWLIISIFIVILTTITVIYKTEVNALVWIISIIFILYCSFFTFKNIYKLYVNY